MPVAPTFYTKAIKRRDKVVGYGVYTQDVAKGLAVDPKATVSPAPFPEVTVQQHFTREGDDWQIAYHLADVACQDLNDGIK